MKNFCVLSRPYMVGGDQTPVVWYVQAIEYAALLLHSDRTLQRGGDRVAESGNTITATIAGWATEDKAYLAINDYYVTHGEQSPYVQLGGNWHDASDGGG